MLPTVYRTVNLLFSFLSAMTCLLIAYQLSYLAYF